MRALRQILGFITLSITLAACSAPAPKLQDSNGNTVRFADYHGKWLVINYWAVWCKPCFEEMPQLNAFYRAHKDKDVVMFGVSYDPTTTEQLPTLIKRMGVQFPVLTTNPAQELGLADVPGLPATFVFGPDGKLKHTLLGDQTVKTLEAAMK